MTKRMAVVLAAGKGTRMKSQQYKVLHEVCGRSMVEHVVHSLEGANVEDIVTIVGHGAEQVQKVLGDRTQFVYQEEQLGTAHAVQQAEEVLGDRQGHTLVVCGDTPLLRAETLEDLIQAHEDSQAQATILTAEVEDATGYGRIVRNEEGLVTQIVEDRDASPEQRAIKEINTGTYVFDNQTLFDLLPQVSNDNDQAEYYLPDVIELIRQDQGQVGAYVMEDAREAIGVNDRVALSQATQIMQERIIHKHMRQGVTFTNPQSVTVEVDVSIRQDTIVEAGVVLKGSTTIDVGCLIGANTEIRDSRIGAAVNITQSVIEESEVGDLSTIGPFAHLRPDSRLGHSVHIGNFVEVKNSEIGNQTRAGHLAYLGDVTMGERVNVGAGTIFVNYDGVRKHRSQVGDDVFIGCDTKLISPVTLEKRTVTGAGSVITEDVPTEALGISRDRQVNVDNFWDRFVNK